MHLAQCPTSIKMDRDVCIGDKAESSKIAACADSYIVSELMS